MTKTQAMKKRGDDGENRIVRLCVGVGWVPIVGALYLYVIMFI